MKLSTAMCRLPFKSGGGIKPPKLSELYEHVFRRKPVLSRLHGSFYDAKILTEIIQKYQPMREALGLSVRNSSLDNVNQGIKDGVLYV